MSENTIIEGSSDDIIKAENIVKRFIWLKSHLPVSNETSQIDNGEEVKKYVKDLVKANPANFWNILRTQTQQRCNVDRVLYCINYISNELKNDPGYEESRNAFMKIFYEDFCDFFTHSKGLSWYMNHYYKKETFSSGFQRALQRWYNKSPTGRLLEIVFGEGHDWIIRRVRPKTDDTEKQEIFAAAFKNYKEISAAAEKSSTMKKILLFKDLKRCQDTSAVVEILKKKEISFKFHHLPTFALKQEVVELILPNLSMTETIDKLPLLYKKKLLAPKTNVPALQGSADSIKEAKLNQVKVLGVIRKISSPEVDPEKKEKKPEHPVVQKLWNIFNHSLGNGEVTGCKFYITLNMRKFSKRQQHPTGLQNISCQEIQTLFALSMLKKEKDVILTSFTEDRHKLKPISWNKKTSYEKAIEIYEKEIEAHPKTKENIELTMKKAIEEKKQIDVFIIFFSSVGRTMGNEAQPPIEALKNYQKVMKSNRTKLVIVNLTHKKSDFKFNTDSKDILEIVGFNAESMKIIEAFSKNCFY